MLTANPMKRSLFAVAGLIAASAGTVAAQAITVVGTGDPRVDIPAVQAAVDQGGRVVLMGHFSFDMSPTTPAGATYSRIVTVARAIVISGKPDEQGEMPAIEGGAWTIPSRRSGRPRHDSRIAFCRPDGGRNLGICSQRSGDHRLPN
jgi:hypothetical protein